VRRQPKGSTRQKSLLDKRLEERGLRSEDQNWSSIKIRESREHPPLGIFQEQQNRYGKSEGNGCRRKSVGSGTKGKRGITSREERVTFLERRGE